MKQTGRWIALALAAVMAASAALPAFAAPTGPGAAPAPERYDEATKARLIDNVIEFDELQNLVHEYNPQIADAWRMYEDAKADYEGIITELESQRPEVDDIVDSGLDGAKALKKLPEEVWGAMLPAGMTPNKMKRQYQAIGDGYRSTIQGMRDVVGKWDTNKQTTKELRKAEKMVTAGAQQALIGYLTIQVNLDTLRTLVQMYERQAQIADRQAALGMATDSALLSAKSSLLSAQSQLASLEGQSESVRRTVCQLLGFDPDSNPEIRPLPEFDMSRLDTMNLEQDTKTAIGNNYTLIGQRTSAKGKTNSQVENRLKMIDEGDQKLTIEMQRLYRDVMDKKAAYEAAQIGYAAAEQSKGSADRMYANGMLAEAQYLGTQIAYFQKKAEKETAHLNLWQAMETYTWALDGQATVE